MWLRFATHDIETFLLHGTAVTPPSPHAKSNDLACEESADPPAPNARHLLSLQGESLLKASRGRTQWDRPPPSPSGETKWPRPFQPGRQQAGGDPNGNCPPAAPGATPNGLAPFSRCRKRAGDTPNGNRSLQPKGRCQMASPLSAGAASEQGMIPIGIAPCSPKGDAKWPRPFQPGPPASRGRSQWESLFQASGARPNGLAPFSRGRQ